MKTPIVVLNAMLLLCSAVCQAEGTAQPLAPKDYSEQHIIASNPKDPKWADAIERLGKLGDGFTVEHLQTIDPHRLSLHEAAVLKAALVALRARVATENEVTFIKSIQLRLERAAWADLSCNALETKLVPWTLATIEKRLDNPDVVAELKRIQLFYVPSVDFKTLFSTLRERVPSYAKRILARAPAPPAENQK